MHDSRWSCGCTPHKICKVLLVIGGLNWGLMGLGMLMGRMMNDWNVVHMLLGTMPTLEAIVYVLVGVAAVMKIFHCRCSKCISCMNGTCDAAKMDKKM